MKIGHVALALGALAFSACSLPNDLNLNNPSQNDFSTIADLPHLQALVSGVVRGDRAQNENEIIYGETIGRDGMRLTGSEPRFVTELLGPSTIDPSDFLGGALWPFATVRLANNGLHGIAGAPSSLLDAQSKPATTGFVQTMKALVMLRIIETHDTAGAAIDVDIDPTGPLAPLRCKNDVLANVAALLDTAATNLAAGGSTFPFSVPAGFAGFDTPATFLKFNRGLAAKVDVYLAFRDYAPLGTVVGTIDQVELDSAQAALSASFMVQDPTKLDLGPAHVYSTATGDAQSNMWDGGLAKTAFRANPRVVTEGAPGDRRLAAKIDSTVGATIGVQGFSSKYVFTLYPDPTSSTPIMRNKELLLLQAEVDWGRGNYAVALAGANFIRTNDGGLAAGTSVAPDSVLNAILYEKRYSLLWETGTRWLDARMFGKLNINAPPAGVGAEQDPGGAPVWNFPIPLNEQNARNGDLSKQACSAPIP
jgi:hypothetical protein